MPRPAGTRFDALTSGDDSSSSSEDDNITDTAAAAGGAHASVAIPSYEDLSLYRLDEETVLVAVYGDDFSKEEGVWGCPCFNVNVRPPDTLPESIGSSLTLRLQLNKKYPYVAPSLEARNVKGLSRAELKQLIESLKARAAECATMGTVVVCDLVQICEDFLLEHNKDPRMSAFDEMQQRQKKELAKQQKQKEQEEQEMNMNAAGYSESTLSANSSTNLLNQHTTMELEEVQRQAQLQLAKQVEALDTARAERRRCRKHQLTMIQDDMDESDDGQNDDNQQSSMLEKNDNHMDHDMDNCDDEDEYDDNLDAEMPLVSSSLASRYETDWVELGLLGRGGGGEVVKARNRLDRRIYAIKKIPLMSEIGRHAKMGRIQNSKLRREITTLSRMAHPYVVRYYQAWVEGGAGGGDPSSSSNRTDTTDSNAVDDDLQDERKLEKQQQTRTNGKGSQPLSSSSWSSESSSTSDSVSDSSDSASDGGGWWSGPPPDSPGLGPLDVADEDESSWSVSEGIDLGAAANPNLTSNNSDSSLDALMKSPLFVGGTGGVGFAAATTNNAYNDIATPAVARTRASSSSDTGTGKRGRESSSDLPFDDDESSMKVAEHEHEILYIQMEYCSNTLRTLIDSGAAFAMKPQERFRIVRQIVEALDYIHGLNIIHRDLKPSNIFLQGEKGNLVQLGDFGLAVARRHQQHNNNHNSATGTQNGEAVDDQEENSEALRIYQAVEDISGLLRSGPGPGGSSTPSSQQQQQKKSASSFLPRNSSQESLTGGVGTTFYRAPEQAGSSNHNYNSLNNNNNDAATEKQIGKNNKNKDSYDTKADIYSLGVVIFELFQKPFATGMERAQTLSSLPNFSDEFREQADEALQKLILSCIAHEPQNRPSARDLLRSDLLPRRLELETKYLSEALEILANPANESNKKIIAALFGRANHPAFNYTFDTSQYIRAQKLDRAKSVASIQKFLGRSVAGGSDTAHRISSMSACSLIAAVSELNRAAKGARAAAMKELNISGTGSEILRGAPQLAAASFASTAAATAAIAGSAEGGILGADPRVCDQVCEVLVRVFKNHGALRLDPPLLRPRMSKMPDDAAGAAPPEFLGQAGSVLLLPEDLTVGFARAVARSGSAATHLKRFQISPTYHRELAAGSHPLQNLEANFDIVHSEQQVATVIEGELLLLLSEILSTKSLNLSDRPWFIKIGHTRLTDCILALCEVPSKASTAVLQILSLVAASSSSALLNLKKHQHQRKGTGFHNDSSEATDARHKTFRDYLKIAIVKHDLPKVAADRLQYLEPVLLSKSSHANRQEQMDAIFKKLRKLQDAIFRLRKLDKSPRRLALSKQAIDFVGSLQRLLTFFQQCGVPTSDACLPPTFMLDLGLRQRQKHIYGGLFFRAFVVSCTTEKDSIDVNSGVKFAEGGRYDFLIGRLRPPGLQSPLPIACGCRFFVGKLVALQYNPAALTRARQNGTNNPIDGIRQSLGHPSLINIMRKTVLVAGANGLDSASVVDRAVVAAKLRAEGIATEYLSTSSMIGTLTNRSRSEVGASDLTLDELTGIAAIYGCSWIVVVVPHLLREKGAVRLRRVTVESDQNEEWIEVENLPVTMKERLALVSHLDVTKPTAERETAGGRKQSSSTFDDPFSSQLVKVEDSQVIVCDEGGYFDIKHRDSSSSRSKAIRKIIKSTSLSADQFILQSFVNNSTPSSRSGGGGSGPIDKIPIIAAKIDYFALRELGTCIMARSDPNIAHAVAEMAETRYPEHRRIFKSVAMAIDHILRKKEEEHNSDKDNKDKDCSSYSSSPGMDMLLYSVLDDQFDLVRVRQTVANNSTHRPGEQRLRSTSFDQSNSNNQKSAGGKRDKGGGRRH